MSRESSERSISLFLPVVSEIGEDDIELLLIDVRKELSYFHFFYAGEVYIRHLKSISLTL